MPTQGITTTGGMLRIGSASYPLAAITSLRVRRKWRPFAGIILIIIFGTIAEIVFEMGGGGWGVLPLLFVVGGVGKLIPQYELLIGTAGGDRVALSGYSPAAVAAGRSEIESAILGDRATV